MPDDGSVVLTRLTELERRLIQVEDGMRTLNAAVGTGMQGLTAQIAALQVSQQREFVSKEEFILTQRRADETHSKLESRQDDLFGKSEETHKRLDTRIDRNEDRIGSLEGKAWLLILACLGAAASFVVGLLDLLVRMPAAK